MNSYDSTTVTFIATAEEKHPSGKAILLLDCTQGKTKLFDRVYMPLSQTRFKIVDAKTKKVEVTIPEWLFDSKMEDEAAFQSDNAVLDQLGLLSIDDANKDYPEKVEGRLEEGRPE